MRYLRLGSGNARSFFHGLCEHRAAPNYYWSYEPCEQGYAEPLVWIRNSFVAEVADKLDFYLGGSK